MNKNEKEIAAIYLSSCLYDMRTASIAEDRASYEHYENAYKNYRSKLKSLLEMKFDMFGLDYGKAVMQPLQEVYKITQVFYSQRVNGQQMKYPA